MASFHNLRIAPRHSLDDVEQAVASYCDSGSSAQHVVYTRLGRDGALYLYPLARAGEESAPLREALMPVAESVVEVLVKRSLWMSMTAEKPDGRVLSAVFPTDEDESWRAMAALFDVPTIEATAWLLAESALHSFGMRAAWDLFCLERGARAARVDGFLRLGPQFVPQPPRTDVPARVRDVRGSGKMRDDGRLRLSLEFDAPGVLGAVALQTGGVIEGIRVRQGERHESRQVSPPASEVSLAFFPVEAPTPEEQALGDRRFRGHLELFIKGLSPGTPVRYQLTPDGSLLIVRDLASTVESGAVQRSPNG